MYVGLCMGVSRVVCMLVCTCMYTGVHDWMQVCMQAWMHYVQKI